MGLTMTEWSCDHDGHTIRVVNTWFSGAKLYVDGDRRDTSDAVFSVDATRPLLSCSLADASGGRSLVEVYLVSIVRTRAMICVDGCRVGGDLASSPPPQASPVPDPYRSTSHASAEVSRLQRKLDNARSLNAALAVALSIAGASALASITFLAAGQRNEPPTARVAPRSVVAHPAGTRKDAQGCADGAREAFRDVARFPHIAACAGGFDVPGLARNAAPVCDRAAGDDGARPDGRGCGAEDLCARGWHVCRSAAEVTARSPDGCGGASDADAGAFFATRQSGPGCGQCATGASPGCDGANCRADCAANDRTRNDIFGCGTLGARPDRASCGPLDRFSHNLCGELRAPWRCDGDPAGLREAELVIKPGPEAGGVLCCAD